MKVNDLFEKAVRAVSSAQLLLACGDADGACNRALRIMWQRWCTGLPTESFEVNLQQISDATE